ncbi:putative transcriptional regulatory protein, GntR family, HTH [Bosea sp. LC85]|uniref:FadR/GntR family transcriptional regulator n=1 Tax=Bosea sp. LC85 TaxID=1502851 RepID=UPI0004E2D2C8|nr:FadR/GntR family transcriptional regulator [Bosea sp. LC85]KFC70049.1 putative transcriptional regulatory protein, GntR family, HTH [Bosea sp. LC85]
MARPSNFHSHLVDRLGRLIVGGEIGNDGSLPREDELATQFAVSRTVIREATKTLQALGLITTGPRVGSRIQPISSWRLLDPQVMDWITDADMASGFERDLLELRSMIEPAAAAFAAERGTPAQIGAVTAALEGMASAPGKAEHEAADFRFHEAILEASGNSLLLQLKPILRAVLKASFQLSMHDHERAQASVAIHRHVASAITARRPEQARESMIALLKVAQADIDLAPGRTAPVGERGESTRNSRETHHARQSRKMDPTRA